MTTASHIIVVAPSKDRVRKILLNIGKWGRMEERKNVICVSKAENMKIIVAINSNSKQ
jgi:hypothetical protein